MGGEGVISFILVVVKGRENLMIRGRVLGVLIYYIIMVSRLFVWGVVRARYSFSVLCIGRK